MRVLYRRSVRRRQVHSTVSMFANLVRISKFRDHPNLVPLLRLFVTRYSKSGSHYVTGESASSAFCYSSEYSQLSLQLLLLRTLSAKPSIAIAQNTLSSAFNCYCSEHSPLSLQLLLLITLSAQPSIAIAQNTLSPAFN